MDYVQHFMKRHRLPQKLRTRISSYYKLLWWNARIGQSALKRANPADASGPTHNG